MDIKILENLLQVTIDRGNLRDRHHQVIQKRINRSGKPEKTSWDMWQQVAPHREEHLLDGNAHSVRYGETIHDGSGKPENLNHQEEANSENFVMGSDAAEFVDKVKDQVRNRQKRMSNAPRNWGITRAKFMVWTKFSGKRILGHVCH